MSEDIEKDMYDTIHRMQHVFAECNLHPVNAATACVAMAMMADCYRNSWVIDFYARVLGAARVKWADEEVISPPRIAGSDLGEEYGEDE